MSTVYNNNTVNDSLLIHIDPANPKSSPGAGNVVLDISGNGNNGTMSNVTYVGDELIFNGIDSTINFGVGGDFFPLPSFTIDLWFSSTGTTPITGTAPGLFGFTYGVRAIVASNYLYFSVDDGVNSLTIQSPSTYDFYNGSWHHFAGVVSMGARYLYVDGEQVASSTSYTWLGDTRWPTNQFVIGRDNNNSNYFFTGSMSSFKFYNRQLSSEEINRNFNAIRGRYGV